MRKSALIFVVTLVLSLSYVPGAKAPQAPGVDGKAPNTTAQKPVAAPRVNAAPKIDADYGNLPVYFIPNQGQLDKQVAYYVQGKDKTLYFTEEGITFALSKPAEESSHFQGPAALSDPAQAHLGLQRDEVLPQRRHVAGWKSGLRGEKDRLDQSVHETQERYVVKLEFVGTAKGVKPVSGEDSGAVVSYFKGKPKDWKTGLRTSSKIVYPNLWPGIDLVYHGTVNRLKYEFIVHPGADPSKIRLAYRGADSMKVDDAGRLNVTTPAGNLQDDVPIAYQETQGKRAPVTLGYALGSSGASGTSMAGCKRNPGVFSVTQAEANSSEERQNTRRGSYGFKIGSYDRSSTLVLDPAILVYCGFVGGLGYEEAGIAIDKSGNAYLTGLSASTEQSFPVTVGPDLIYNGQEDAFVAKVNAAGTALVYCGYIGGSSQDEGDSIAVDDAGNAYVAGDTKSTEATFPVTIGPDLIYNGGDWDGFVAKVNAEGTALIYCGYLGGNSYDYAVAIAVDLSGNAYVTGQTGSSDATFPVTVGPSLTYHGGSGDAFVAKLNAQGTAFVYGGYIGGIEDDMGYGIAVDSSGTAYITGRTLSTEATFPVTVGPDLTYNGGQQDAFVAKVNAAGTSLIYCGYIGGSDNDLGYGIAVDGSGSAYISGLTESNETTFPVMVGPDLTYNGGKYGGDAFIAKVNESGTALIYCGYIGGSGDDTVGGGIAVDSLGNAYVSGKTSSTETTFPVTVGPDLTYNGGIWDAFVAKINPAGTALVYCGYIGGSDSDGGSGVGVDDAGNAYISGGTWSTEATFPVTVGPDLTQNGSLDQPYPDAFVAKVSYYAAGTPHLAMPVAPISFGNVNVGHDLDLATIIRNDGDAALVISGIGRSSGSADFACLGPSTPFTVFPGGSQAVTVRFLPQSLGQQSARIAVDSNDSAEPHVTFWVSGAGATMSSPDIRLPSASLAYGDIRPGSSSDLDLLIQNLGDAYLLISAVTRTAGNADFSVISFPSSIAAGCSGSVRVRFSPISAGGKIALFQISSNDPDEPEASVLVTGGARLYDTSPSNHKVLPEAIWAPAARGGTWVTQVQITDMTGGSIVSVYFSYGGGKRRGPIALWSGSGKDNSAKFENLLSALGYLDEEFGYYGRVGAVDFVTQDAEHEIQVAARTLNGACSKTMPAFNLNDSNTVDTAHKMIIQGLADDGVMRSTCGFYNPTPVQVVAEFLLLDPGGDAIGSSFTKSFAGYDFQAFRPRDEIGRPDLNLSGILLVHPLSERGKLTGFGALANNTSNDPAALFAAPYEGSADGSPSSLKVLPEAVWAPASGGGNWISAVQVTDVSGGSVVSAYFDYGGGARRGPFTLWANTLGPGVSFKTENILSKLRGSGDRGFTYYGREGAVEFFTQDAAHKIQVFATTMNGDYSKTLPTLSLSDSNTADMTRKMMIQDLPNTATYRSSCGFFNPTNDPVTVEFRMIDRWGGTRGAAFTKTFVGHDFQAFNPYVEAGIAAPSDFYDNMFLLINPISGAGKILGFGASANNISNDPAAHIAQQYQ